MQISCCQKGSGFEIDVQPTENDRWFELSNARFRMIVFGHLYCRNTRELDLEHNMRALFATLASSEDLTAFKTEIAGGLFSLFLFDQLEQSLCVQADRYGFKPLYYKKTRDAIFFSDQEFRLACSSRLPASRLSAPCVDEFLSYGYLPYSDSLYEDIAALKQGEVLKVKAGDALNFSSSTPLFHCYPAPSERLGDLDAAVESIYSALDQFYSRCKPNRYCLGLSGGYDSRLIAAYLAPFQPQLINFGNPRSLEVEIAEHVAARLKLNLRTFAIPRDAVEQAAAAWKQLIRPYCDLSYAHVALLVSEIKKAQADYYVDGFLGDTVIGAGYYYKLGKDPWSLAGNLLFLNRYRSEIRDLDAYCNVRALSALGREALMEKQRLHVLRQKERCWTHEDMQEALLFTTRGRKLIASGPNAVSTAAVCLCPYVDYAVYDAAMAVSKELRAGNTLYNALWRRKFLALADIPKNDTGSSPSATPFGYRFMHAVQAVKRRVFHPLLRTLTAGLCDYREEYSSVNEYLKDIEIQRFVGEELGGLVEEAASLLKVAPEDLIAKAADERVLILRFLALKDILRRGIVDSV